MKRWRRCEEVEAVCLTEDNLWNVKEWLDNFCRADFMMNGNYTKGLEIRKNYDAGERPLMAYYGDYIVKDRDNFIKVVRKGKFEDEWEEIE